MISNAAKPSYLSHLTKSRYVLSAWWLLAFLQGFEKIADSLTLNGLRSRIAA